MGEREQWMAQVTRLEAEVESLRKLHDQQRTASEFWERRYNEQHRTLHSAEDLIAELRAELARLRAAAQAVVRADESRTLARSDETLRQYVGSILALRAVLASTGSEERQDG